MTYFIILFLYMFYCKLTFIDVTPTNISSWKKKLQLLLSSPITIPKSFFNKYGVQTMDEYIQMIESNINNDYKINEITSLFNKNLIKDLEIGERKEKKRIENLVMMSIRKINNDVMIRMLIDEDVHKAIVLYTQYKILMNEETEKVNDYINDFILKNIIFGIFEVKELVGIIIIDFKKFRIDDCNNEVNTFYIQEMIIEDKFRGKGYANMLITYIIERCPIDIKYISYMTMPTNNAMIKIGIKNIFKLQKITSGDNKHSLLFIKINLVI